MNGGADAAGLAEEARGARRLGLLGGSFDPPHLGHVHVARAARKAFALDHVVLVPAARPPHKLDHVLTPGEERVRMLELLLEGEDWTSVWSVELHRAGPSYTVDTVRTLQRLLSPAAEVFLLIGTDTLAGFHTWHRVAELIREVVPVVVRRSGETPDLDALERVAPGARERARTWLLDVEPYDASATEIRARLERGEDPGPALPAAVREYVRARSIYRDRG